MTAGAVAVPTIVPLRAPIPGQHKSCIDTETKIEIRSETSGATIYYSTNGAKPEPFQRTGPAANSTFKYREPFRLPGGKKTVKAIAISECGLRESFVVTKTFDVEDLGGSFHSPTGDDYKFIHDAPIGNEQAKREVRKFANKMVTSKEAWAEVEKMRQTEDMMREMSVHGSHKRRPGTGARHLNGRLGDTASRAATNGSSHMMNGSGLEGVGSPERTRRLPPDTATQAMRLQRETDFMKCVYCFAPRPSDPYSRFCNDCGNPVPPLPQTRMPPPEPGQMGTCVSCRTLVPFNTAVCLVCEAPIPPQNVPQASVRLTNKAVCTVCGTGNPANVTSCLACESRLATSTAPMFHGTSAPPLPKADGRLVSCTKCGRVNNPDARFCDWCGAKPSPTMSSLVCSKCHASNQPYAKHCASCGVMLEAPQRPDVRNAGLTLNTSGLQGVGKSAQWLPVSLPGPPVPKFEMATQTVGLFFPSTKELTRKQTEEEEKFAQEKLIRDRKPLMTAVSPGRGYWRKQMDHVCAHLKAYTQNNAEFRALIGEPKMGKLISATVHEDGYELSLTVNFALRGHSDPFVGKKLGVTNEFLSSYTTGRKASLNSYASEDSLMSGGESTARSGVRSRGKKRVVKKAKKKVLKEDKLSPEDRELLKEIGKNGDGSATEVQRLIDEGADANCENKDGVPALHVAVANRHVDAIPILIQEGADANKKGPNKGNTALHECVSLGTKGLEVIDTLIDCGAKPQKKNDKGQTPYDLAVQAGYDSVAGRFTTSLGQTALDKMMKTKSSLAEPDDY